MTKTTLTIGLFDKDTESQKIGTESAKSIIADILLNRHNIFAFTMIDCNGYYKMQSTGNIVNEPSIRVEIATDDDLRYHHNNLDDDSTWNYVTIQIGDDGHSFTDKTLESEQYHKELCEKLEKEHGITYKVKQFIKGSYVPYDSPSKLESIVNSIKSELNQETVMVEVTKSDISFI